VLLSVAVGWLAFGDVPDAIALLGIAMIAASPQLTRLRVASDARRTSGG
jgi:drug/metabolite transporter (DMT)-like permease